MGKQLTGAAPASGDNPLSKANTPETKGKLFVIEPFDVESGIVTDNGTTDATRANIWVVRSKDGTKYDEYLDTLVFPRVIQGQLRAARNKSVVFGRLTQGEAKPGKNAPWVLADPTPADTAAASAFWSARSLAGASSDTSGDDTDEFADDGEDSF
jgi:hypothetical protein